MKVYRAIRKFLRRNKNSVGKELASSFATEESVSSEFLSGKPDEPPLLVRIGNINLINKIVCTFQEMVETDVSLIGFFYGMNEELLSLHHKRFLSMAFTRVPETSSLAASLASHHRHLFEQSLDGEHFDMLVRHMVAAMRIHGICERHVEEAVYTVAPLRSLFEHGNAEEWGRPLRKIERAQAKRRRSLDARTL